MKANTPEKLYINLFKGEFNVSYSPTNNSVEYIRKDIFIEKVMKYIANHFLVPGMDSEIKDFVNYMEGE